MKINIYKFFTLIFLSTLSTVFAQNDFNKAHSYNIKLEKIRVLDIETEPNIDWKVLFLDNDEIVYAKHDKSSRRNQIVIADLRSGSIKKTLSGTNLHAVSSDNNRIFYDQKIYDRKQNKVYPLSSTPNANTKWYRSQGFLWYEPEKIIAYRNQRLKNGKLIPKEYYYFDLNDLQLKVLDDKSKQIAFKRYLNEYPSHPNFYLYQTSSGSSIKIQGKLTSYGAELMKWERGYPIDRFWQSPNLEYIVVDRYSKTYTNRSELSLYKLVNGNSKMDISFKCNSPINYISDEFKKYFDKGSKSTIWASVYEPKINSLTNKVIGPDRNQYIGNARIVTELTDNEYGLQMGFQQGKTMKKGQIVTDFRINERTKDGGGAWATLEEWSVPTSCNMKFGYFELGDDKVEVLYSKTILNTYQESVVNKTGKGCDTPGNECSNANEQFFDALKKFQKLQNIPVTGKVDAKTIEMFEKRCAEISEIRDFEKFRYRKK
ncbi:peptidoglycan-binding domain-containing protein [Jejudonia soesokkakensis]|uniref:Peptidoglycan-binding domain-containing protein n=1 Tax=Jejudonia soesokkakensis TaxID=1323432 RepID=A0ABW2MSL4_9FLAO